MKQFFLPLYDYENQFCEKCEIDDHEDKCHCNNDDLSVIYQPLFIILNKK